MKKGSKSAGAVLAAFALLLAVLGATALCGGGEEAAPAGGEGQSEGAASVGAEETAPAVAGAQGEEAAPADVEMPEEEAPRLIALTFDDGPRRATTTELLDGLSQRGVRATFFLIGEQIVGNEDLIQRMDAEGHQIGVHTYDHVKLTGLNRADFDAQVDKTRYLLQTVLGHGGFMLRPPYGMLDDGVRAMAESPIILWSVDPEDWGDKNADRIVAHITQEAKDGSIILLHDIYPTSVEAALRVVDALHEQGYLFVTVEQLFAARGVELQAGEVYRSAYP